MTQHELKKIIESKYENAKNDYLIEDDPYKSVALASAMDTYTDLLCLIQEW